MSKECCPTEKTAFKFDPILHGSFFIITLAFMLHAFDADIPGIHPFVHTLIELFNTMWWGVALGLLSVGLMNKIPREYFTHVMGRGDKPADIIKAAIAGVILDLCNHGILVVAGKLYERGLSIAQVLTFLIASPWNSLSLTFILIALIGLKWTLTFTLASMLIAIISGFIYMALIKAEKLPKNPNTTEMPLDFDFKNDFKTRIKGWRPSLAWAEEIATDGWKDGQAIIRWIVFGALVAALMRAYVPSDIFSEWLGPTIAGLAITLLIATIVEICSEGSAPIAAEIMNSANAPGNGFTFLMAGVSTDYTEILVVKEFSKSWMIALSLPLITVPQIIVLGLIFNAVG